MEEKFGGPVWHASGRGQTAAQSRRIARDALYGVGDGRAGEWTFDGSPGTGIVHLLRRLSDAERAEFGVPEPFDIRGTDDERRRVGLVVAEAPHLRAALARMEGRR